MTRFALAVIFSVIILGRCGAQTPGSQKAAFAAFLIANGDVDAAALEYERRLAAGRGDSTLLACMLGELYLKSDPAKAEVYFSGACESSSPGTGLRRRAENGLITAYLMQRKSILARNELAEAVKKDSVLFSPASRAFLECAINVSLYQVDSARLYLSLLSKDTLFLSRATRIDALLSWYRNQKLKNPVSTYVYATAVPGWGQWYNNDKKGAVAGFSLMATLTGILGWEAYRFYRGDRRQRYVCGMDIFLVGGLLWRRYQGSIRKAAYNESLTINATIQLEYQKRLRSILCME